MEIRNKSTRALKLSLPGGKRLFLGLRGTGQITAKAAEHPPIKKLIDAGDLEVFEKGLLKGKQNGAGGGMSGSQSGSGGGGMRRTGDG